MSESKSFRIIVDLSRFFCDHRRIARVFVKSNLKSIEDLKNRISEIFGISGFYLSTGGHFLPPSEDIRILHHDETVCVSPNEVDSQDEYLGVSSSHLNTIKNKQQKRSLGDMAEENTETSSPKRKKKKKHHSKDASHTSNSEDENKHKKKMDSKSEKESKNTKNVKSKLEDQKLAETEEKLQKDKREKACNIEEASTKIIEIKKKLKQKADEYSQKHFNSTPVKAGQNFKTVLPKLQTHIKNCNNSGRPTISDTVRLSRHVDTPIKKFSKYTSPVRITDQYLAKTKINIVKIDVIKENSEEATTSKNCESDNKCDTSKEGDSPSESYVKKVVNSIEMNLSSEGKVSNDIQKGTNKSNQNVDASQTEASNYTKIYLDQKNANESTIVVSKPENANVCDVSSVDTSNLVKALHESNSEPEQGKKVHEGISPLKTNATATDISLDISTVPSDSHSSHDVSLNSVRDSTDVTVDSNSNTLRTSKKRSSNKVNLGVGSLLEYLRESDSVLSQESDSSQYITTRKRTRKHKRSKKKLEGKEELKLEDINPAPKLIATSRPKIHIKFEDSSTPDIQEISSDLIQDTIQVQPTYKETEKDQESDDLSKTETTTITIGDSVVISDEIEDTVIKKENILKAPMMENKIEPKVGDIIAFKILKMTENYSPQISGYITGKVEMYLMESKVVYFKILSGQEELLPPSGRLSLDTCEKEEVQNSKYKEFSWGELIEQRLLYP